MKSPGWIGNRVVGRLELKREIEMGQLEAEVIGRESKLLRWLLRTRRSNGNSLLLSYYAKFKGNSFAERVEGALEIWNFEWAAQ